MSIKNRTLERGRPDYHNVRKAALSVALQDMGELAARLGSTVTFDRQGEVILLETFENTVNSRWLVTLVGAATAAISATTARNGASSLQLVTGAAAAQFASIKRGFVLTEQCKYGFEYSFSVGYLDTYKLAWDLSLSSATYNLGAFVEYDAAAQTLVVNDDGTLRTIASGLALYEAAHIFNTAKLVVDAVTGKYSHLRLNDQTYDLSAYTLASDVPLAPYGGYATIQISTTTAAAVTGYIDDVIITQNEE